MRAGPFSGFGSVLLKVSVVAARSIFLVGFSGTGKSTIARLVGEHLQWPVYDLDQVIVERSGMPIPVIFEREGEAGFRMREREALHTIPDETPCVVATGAGAVVAEENRRVMASKGWIVALEGRPEVLYARMQQQLQRAEPDAFRPLLHVESPLEQIRALKDRRQAVYALADWTVHTDRLSPQEVAAEVIRAANVLAHTADPTAR